MNTTLEKAVDTITSTTNGTPLEGRLTKMVEFQTAKIPSLAFFSLGMGSIVASLMLAASGKRFRQEATFVGLWAPTFLLIGIYNKLVKLQGSDRSQP